MGSPLASHHILSIFMFADLTMHVILSLLSLSRTQCVTSDAISLKGIDTNVMLVHTLSRPTNRHRRILTPSSFSAFPDTLHKPPESHTPWAELMTCVMWYYCRNNQCLCQGSSDEYNWRIPSFALVVMFHVMFHTTWILNWFLVDFFMFSRFWNWKEFRQVHFF